MAADHHFGVTMVSDVCSGGLIPNRTVVFCEPQHVNTHFQDSIETWHSLFVGERFASSRVTIIYHCTNAATTSNRTTTLWTARLSV